MADTMFPTNPPPMPPEFMDAMADTGPGPFVDAMGGGMEAFAGAMQGGGDMAAGGEAFMDFMHDACANGDIPGVTPEMFDSVADGFADVAGPAMMGLPADAGPAAIGEVFADAAALMAPPGFDMPPEVADMCSNMGDTFADCGVGPHDVGAEFGPPMPDGFVPGDPNTFPVVDVGPPPGDMAGGPMGGPQDGPPAGDGMNMGGDAAANMGMDAAANMDPPAPPPPGDMAGGPMGGPQDGPPAGDGMNMGGDAASALGGALGAGPVDGPGDVGAGAAALGGAAAAGDMAATNADPAAAADAAIGSAMDAAMEQGGAPEAAPVDDGAGAGDGPAAAGPEDEVDPSAGMG